LDMTLRIPSGRKSESASKERRREGKGRNSRRTVGSGAVVLDDLLLRHITLEETFTAEL
jgi:hypothetical protein